MSVHVGEIQATFRLIDQLTPGLRAMETEIANAAKAVSDSAPKIEAVLGRVSTSATNDVQKFAEFCDRMGIESVAAGEQAAGAATATLTQIGQALQEAGGQLKKAGTGLSLAITAPFAAIAALSFNEVIGSSQVLAAEWATVKEQGAEVATTIAQVFEPAIRLALDAAVAILPHVQSLAEWFSNLPDSVQIAAVGLGTLAAAAGPVLVAVGSLVTTIGALTPMLPAIGAALSLLTGPIGLIAGLVAGLGLAWMTWGDDVTRVSSSVFQSVKSWLWDKLEPVLTPIAGLLDSLGEAFEAFGMLTGAVLEKFVEMHVKAVGTVISWLVDRLEPVFRPIGVAVQGMAAIFGRAYTSIAGFVENTFTAVRTFLLDRFTSIVDGIKGKIDAVTGFFRGMYDAVVGHSFVPDMIAGITTEFGKLSSGMVTPSETATGTVGGFFSGMASSVTKTLGDGFSDWLTRSATFRDDFGGIWGTLASNFGGLVEGMGKQLSSFMEGGRLSMASFLTDMGNFASRINSDLTGTIFNAWLKAALGEHRIHGGGEEDERRRREEDERYFPQTPGYEPPSNEGTGNPYPFAAGGVVTRPTVGLVGEAGPEAIIPLKQWGGMGGDTHIHIHADGAVFADESAMRRFASLLMPQIAYALRREGLAQ